MADEMSEGTDATGSDRGSNCSGAAAAAAAEGLAAGALKRCWDIGTALSVVERHSKLSPAERVWPYMDYIQEGLPLLK
jgi:hypothetical protein